MLLLSFSVPDFYCHFPIRCRLRFLLYSPHRYRIVAGSPKLIHVIFVGFFAITYSPDTICAVLILTYYSWWWCCCCFCYITVVYKRSAFFALHAWQLLPASLFHFFILSLSPSFFVVLQMGWLWFVMGWKINFRGQPFYFRYVRFISLHPPLSLAEASYFFPMFTWLFFRFLLIQLSFRMVAWRACDKHLCGGVENIQC